MSSGDEEPPTNNGDNQSVQDSVTSSSSASADTDDSEGAVYGGYSAALERAQTTSDPAVMLAGLMNDVAFVCKRFGVRFRSKRKAKRSTSSANEVPVKSLAPKPTAKSSTSSANEVPVKSLAPKPTAESLTPNGDDVIHSDCIVSNGSDVSMDQIDRDLQDTEEGHNPAYVQSLGHEIHVGDIPKVDVLSKNAGICHGI